MSATTAIRVADPAEQPFYSVATLAKKLAVSDRTVRDLLNRGDLHAFTIAGHRGRRIAATELDRFLATVLDQPHPLVEHATFAGVMPGKYEGWDASERDYAYVVLADPCSYCSAPASQVDHIDPKAGGGEHSWENFTAACKRCNSGKRMLPLLTFLARRAG